MQHLAMLRVVSAIALFLAFCSSPCLAAEPTIVNLWPGKAPNETKELPPEADTTKPGGGMVAGKSVIRLGNVSTPQLHIYRPAADKDTGASVVICPGGGHNILAWDLEGTEVADWLNTVGVTGIVLKYRVPARDPMKRWIAGVQDAQRAMSLVRSKAKEWKLDPKRIGILGFSAGGEVAGLTSLLPERQYEASDDVDIISSRPDFAVLVYCAYLAKKDEPKLRDEVKVTKDAPPMFLVHAYNDGVTPMTSLLLATELKKVGVAAELHMYATGGHGFGLRATEEPSSQWPKRCEEWMKRTGLLKNPQLKIAN